MKTKCEEVEKNISDVPESRWVVRIDNREIYNIHYGAGELNENIFKPYFQVDKHVNSRYRVRDCQILIEI